MLEHQLAVFLHVLLAVYWLGADVAVYYISHFMTDRSQPTAVRLFATRVMLHLDMFPRTCLPLTLFSGVWLAQLLGLIALPAAAMVLPLVGIATLLWIALIWAVHKDSKSARGLFFAKFDWTIRLTLIAGIALLLVQSVRGKGIVADVLFVQIKLAIFAAIIALGLVIRVQLKPLGPLLAEVAGGQASAASEQAFSALLRRVKGVVWAIWALLWLAIWLGLSKSLPW
jgi:hypothetical protein